MVDMEHTEGEEVQVPMPPGCSPRRGGIESRSVVRFISHVAQDRAEDVSHAVEGLIRDRAKPRSGLSREWIRVPHPGTSPYLLPIPEDGLGSVRWDQAGSEHGDTDMTMFAVVPAEAVPAQGKRIIDDGRRIPGGA